MLTGTLFWVLAQQGGSSISLFIDRFVNRRLFTIEVPTALFQSVNAVAVMAAGVALAWLMRPEGSTRSVLRVWLKFAFGLVLMGCGFIVLALNARHGAVDGQAQWADGRRTGADGLCRTVYRPGGDGADHA
jgi:POT family proton-dependent oligopeptide transporter